MVDVRHREETSPSYSWYVRDWRASHRVSKLSWKERGFYRECLDWSWDLDGLPNDLEFIRGRLHATKGDFDKLWPAARGFFDVALDGRLRNARQELERRKQQGNRRRASDGGTAKAEAIRQVLHAVAAPEPSTVLQARASSTPATQSSGPASSSASHSAPLSPSPSPLPVPGPSPLRPTVTARSKRPLFNGQRLTVFEWMFDDLRQMLGVHTDGFGLDEWFYAADAKALTLPMRKREEWWPWLLGETLEEAKRRGLPVSTAEWAKSGEAIIGKQTTRLARALANIHAEADRDPH